MTKPRFDVVSYDQPIPRGPVQKLALMRARTQAPPKTPAPRHSAELAERAVLHLLEFGDSSARDIAQAVFGEATQSRLCSVGTALSGRKRTVGDVSLRRIKPCAPGTSRTLWFLTDPAATAEGQTPTLRELDRRLARLEADVRQVLTRMKAIFRCGVWDES